ncbi:transglycosylase SLT domain-containing protein [uncultured Cobetia sp.]|uniref:lytic transglycosylase domain-containing protein n=1 Tax=uncultured Cobetia sp. TaxID=410706 RepID=UPI0030EECDA9
MTISSISPSAPPVKGALRRLRPWLAAVLLTLSAASTGLTSPPVQAAAAIPEHGLSPGLRDSLREALAEPEAFEDPIDALHWVLSMQQRLERYMPDRAARIDLLRKVRREATRTGLAPELILSVIQVESAFKPTAVSHAGARGLMQVMPFWKREIGEPDDNLLDQDTSLRYGATILAHYLKREKGDITDALARYNGSLGKTWYPERVMRAWTTRWWYQAPAPFVAERSPEGLVDTADEDASRRAETSSTEPGQSEPRHGLEQSGGVEQGEVIEQHTGAAQGQHPLAAEDTFDGPANRSLAAGGSP